MLVCSTMILPAAGAKPGPRRPPQVHPVSPTVEPQIDVASAGDLDRRHAGNRRQLGRQFFRDLSWGLLELLRQRKSYRQRQLAERHLARLLDNDRADPSRTAA